MVWLNLNVSGKPVYSTYSTYSTLGTTGRRVSGTLPLGFRVRCGDLVVVMASSCTQSFILSHSSARRSGGGDRHPDTGIQASTFL